MSVSVIIPAYNAERWLPETLKSVLEQGVHPMEVIIVDDGSTDSTPTYVLKDWPQYTLIRTENCGVSHARNLGMAKARGDFIQFLDADDLLEPGKIRRQLDILLSCPDADVVYSNWQRLVEAKSGMFIREEVILRTIEDIDADPEIAFFDSMWCPTGAYLYRRSFLAKVGEWKSWLPVIQDARFAWDCARAGARWAHDEAVSTLYRQHSTGSVSTRSRVAFLKDCWANTDDIKRIWEEDGTLTGKRFEVMQKAYHHLARNFFEVDKVSFANVRAQLLKMNPNFQPPERLLRCFTAALGYEAAEQTAAWYRKAKRCFFNLTKKGSHQ